MNHDTIKLTILQLVYDHQDFEDGFDVNKVIRETELIYDKFFSIKPGTIIDPLLRY